MILKDLENKLKMKNNIIYIMIFLENIHNLLFK